MGCSPSIPGNKVAADPTPKHEVKKVQMNDTATPKQEEPLAPQEPPAFEGPLSGEEIKSRIVSGAATHYIKAKSGEKVLHLNYAWVSQRGYYPEDLDKANQDSFLIQPNFNEDGSRAFFGVFDGHGKYGDKCSIFVRDKLAPNLQKHPQNKTDFMRAYEECFVETNKQLHKQRGTTKGIDDSMSGTTAITVVFDEKDIYVANVGDSRAIVCEEDENRKISAYALSIDQTPFRVDERNRCIAAGARVLTMDQIDGIKEANKKDFGTEEDDDGDPPRLWLPDKRYPGTAFTRSIGDSVAETIGVYAEPEILVKTIEGKDKFVIIASDGVFEFLSNQSVSDMASKFENPLDAARAIVAESYRLWLQFEVRTDDITAIVIRLKEITQDVPDDSISSEASPKHGRLSLHKKSGLTKTYSANMTAESEMYIRNKSARPVRRTFTRAKKIEINTGLSASLTEEEMNYVPPVKFNGSEDEYVHLDEAVKASFLFQHLNEVQREGVFNSMIKEQVKNGDTIINQGDAGDKFYIIEYGSFDVLVVPKKNDGEIAMPVVVHTYTATSGNYPSFGELALMYDKPRAATVKAVTDGVLWALSRTAFRSIVMKDSNEKLIKTLASVSVLKGLDKQQLQRLADVLTQVHFNEGESIIKQGDIGDTFFVIKSGNVKVTKKDEGSEETKVVMNLSANNYFGERALMSGDKRAANVIAQGAVICLTIGRDVFEEILGPLQDIIDYDRRRREKIALAKQNMIKRSISVNLGKPLLSDFESGAIVHKTDLNYLQLVRHTSTRRIFTMQTAYKQRAVELKRTSQIMEGALKLISFPNTSDGFVPEILCTFSDEYKLYSLINAVIVCDIDSLLSMCEKMKEEEIGFYVGSLILALKHIHTNGMHYRSCYPEHILLNKDGFPILMNFQLAKLTTGKTYTICGSPDFFAPEIINHEGADYRADWWSLGVIICELITGRVPFSSENTTELDLYENIINFKMGQLKLPNISIELQELVNGLLNPNSVMRLGVGLSGPASGADQIMETPWCKKYINFSSLKDKTATSPHAELIQTLISKFIDDGSSDIPEETNIPAYKGAPEWFADW